MIYEAVEFHGCFCAELELRNTLTFCGVFQSDLWTSQPVPHVNVRPFSAAVYAEPSGFHRNSLQAHETEAPLLELFI